MQIQVVRSRRKTLAMTVKSGELIEIRAPYYVRESEIREFVSEHSAWIEKQISRRQEEEGRLREIQPLSREALEALAQEALRDLPERVRHYAPQVGVSFGRITVRNQKSKWGSCSSRGNLNFNCLLMLAPDEVRNYVVVHELCHRKEMNHSPCFWAEVERILPDYKSSRRWLKEHGAELMLRNPHARKVT